MKMVKRWDIWGLLAGALLGISDYGLFRFLGIDMFLADRLATLEVSLFITVTYMGFGFVIGKLIQARAQARADAQTIATQMQALEQSRQQAFQNEKLAAIGRLAAGIAHEVRNPLGIIRASAAMVRESFSSDDEAHRACEFIQEETDRLNGLITSLLTFAKPAELRLQPVPVEQLINRVMQLSQEQLRQSSITVRQENSLELDTLPEVSVDPDLMAQVLFDLVTNATEAIGQHGEICVRVGNANGALDMEVADSGPGVPADEAGKIFEPFFTTKPKGTGLGLAMADRIVRAHGGSIEVAQDKGAGKNGAGACFCVRVPMQPDMSHSGGLA